MKLCAGLLSASVLALAATSAVAQEAAPAHGRWIVDLGAAVRLRPSRIGANTYELDLLPVVEAAYGKRLRLSLDDGARWAAVKAGRLSLGPVVEYRQAYNDLRPPRSARIADALEAGAFSQVDLTYAVLEGRFRKALNAYRGYSGDVSLDTLVPLRPQLGLGLEARLGWADRKFTQTRFVGIAAPGAPLSGVRDYWSAGVQAGLIYRTRAGYGLTLGFSEDVILRPSRDLSRYRTRNAFALGLSITKRFISR